MLATLMQYEDSGTDAAAAAGFGLGLMLFWLLIIVIMGVSMWKLFVKMGDPGWMGIIPILNIYRIFQRSRPDQAILWTILTFVCGIGAFVAVFDLAKLPAVRLPANARLRQRQLPGPAGSAARLSPLGSRFVRGAADRPDWSAPRNALEHP